MAPEIVQNVGVALVGVTVIVAVAPMATWGVFR